MTRYLPAWSLRRAAGSLTAAALVAAACGLAAGAPQAAAAPVSDPASYVNPMIGTGSGGQNVGANEMFPGPDAPFGMIQWSPDTSPAGVGPGGTVGYAYSDSTMHGFSLTHLSGVGCYLYRDVEFLPTTTPVTASPGTHWSSYTSGFSHSDETAKAGYYGVGLSSGVRAELTTTTRTALSRFSYPAGNTATMLIDASTGYGNNGSALRIAGPDTIVGSATGGHFCGHSQAQLYTLYFAVQFDHPFASYGTWQGGTMNPGATSVNGTHAGGWVSFDTSGNPTVNARVAISYVSTAGAMANLASVSPDFATVRSQTYAEWNSLLGKIQIAGGSSSQLATFYTALYHALLGPTVFSDGDGSYLGFDNKVHSLPPGHTQYTNFSGWDIYRSEVQLLAMLDPGATSDMMQSLVNDAEQGGWLPKFPNANTYTAVDGGDSADPIIADAYAFGARGFDVGSALKYMVKGADDTTSPAGQGWYYPRDFQTTLLGVTGYRDHGYVPTGPDTTGVGASLTEEFAVDDFAIAQLAGATGDSGTSDTFARRGQNWENVFDPVSGYIQPRGEDGVFLPAADPATTQNGFEEGNAAQYTWMNPQNLAGLFNAMGGRAAAVSRLNTFFTQLNAGTGAPYYWAGNEPNLGIPWEYDYAGAPYRTQAVVRNIITSLYRDAPGGEPGNDDVGALSSWYVWSALGLYPETPGAPVLAVGSPLFPKAVITLAGNRSLTINAPQASASTPYVQSLKLNGSPDNKPWLPGPVLSGGATLDFTLGGTPDTGWGAAPQDAPPSYRAGETPAIGFLPRQQVVVPPGGSATAQVGAQDITGRAQTVQAAVSPPAGITVSVAPATGAVHVPPAGKGYLALTVHAGPATPQGFYTVPISLTAGGVTLPQQNLTVAVAQPGALWPYYNNTGISSDGQTVSSSFDGSGWLYSANELAADGLGPGASVAVDGVTYTWPDVAAGRPDNIVAAGQTIPVAFPAATKIGLIGSASGGASTGTITVTYTDGTTQQIPVGFSDWTLGAGKFQPLPGDTVVAKATYRNNANGGRQNLSTYMFATDAALQPGKTAASVTLPASASGGIFHVFALGSG